MLSKKSYYMTDTNKYTFFIDVYNYLSVHIYVTLNAGPSQASLAPAIHSSMNMISLIKLSVLIFQLEWGPAKAWLA